MSQTYPHTHAGEEAFFTVSIEGLSKRELFAALAMQGIASSSSSVASLRAGFGDVFPHVIVSRSIQLADALLAELAKEPTTKGEAK